MTKPRRDVLIVGSVPLADADEVFRTIADILGERVERMPDGETGKRAKWIEWQSPVFDDHPLFERIAQETETDWRNKEVDKSWRLSGWHVVRAGVSPQSVSFGPLGYAAAARASYRVFSQLKRDRVVNASCRFQVSIPTPYNVIDQLVAPDHRLAVEPAYEARILAEIDEIAATIPHRELAIQWDAAHEVQNLAGGRPHWFDEPERRMIERLVRLGDRVPGAVELGYHLCYGDFGHRHIIEPTDAGLMVRLSNALAEASHRPIQWIHMPVPRNRSDAAYFAPLGQLRLRPETRLYLGLVHLTDGVAGTRRRIEAAARVVNGFGISTECGFGRRDPATIPALLRIHAEVCDLNV
ncbi:MAG TPA: hypothetical protein VNE82_06505 [Candidatus Binataceae bacterium]|nr:hypothetical protein [Candidatus Binataceae bacterium]